MHPSARTPSVPSAATASSIEATPAQQRRRASASIAIITAGLLWAFNLPLMVYAQADLYPFQYAGYTMLASAVTYAIAFLFLTRRARIPLRNYLSTKINYRYAVYSAATRASHALYIIAGPYVHDAIVTATFALNPTTYMVANWLTRRRSSYPLHVPKATVVLTIAGAIGALACVTAQPSPDGASVKLLDQPIQTAIGLAIAAASISFNLVITSGTRFWLENRKHLATPLTPDQLALPATTTTALTFAVGAAVISAAAFAIALVSGETGISDRHIIIPIVTGIDAALGLLLYSYGSAAARTLPIQNAMLAEPAVGILLVWALNLAPELNWTIMALGVTTATITAMLCAAIERRTR